MVANYLIPGIIKISFTSFFETHSNSGYILNRHQNRIFFAFYKCNGIFLIYYTGSITHIINDFCISFLLLLEYHPSILAM